MNTAELVTIVLYSADSSYFSNFISEVSEPRSTSVLYDQLMRAFMFQGISDAAARTFSQRHGHATWDEVQAAVAAGPACPKLANYWRFMDCGFGRSAGQCSRPEHYPTCPLPDLPLRRGSLNQAAYSLFLFIRDVCEGDLCRWLDQRLDDVPRGSPNAYGRDLAEAVCEPMSHIYGVSRKVVHMALSDLLLGFSACRPLWREAAANMIAIDTLVHNLLDRTGTLRAQDAQHLYGPACYRPGGCADIVRELASQIDARTVRPEFPVTFPRLIQHALWRYCAQEELDICNGVQVSKFEACDVTECVVFDRCEKAP